MNTLFKCLAIIARTNSASMRISALGFIAMLIATSNLAVAQTAIVRVDINNGVASPPNFGDDWGTDAYKFLQDALDAADVLLEEPHSFDDVHIWVAAGTYKPGTTTASTFSISSNVQVYGGFAGGESFLSQRNPFTNITILSGDVDDDDDWGDEQTMSDNCHHVVTFTNTNTTARLDGFTITGGNAASGTTAGGGVLMVDSSALVANCTLYRNRAASGGGASVRTSATAPYFFFEPTETPRFFNCSFIENDGGSSGGGISNFGTVLELLNCLFVRNVAERGGAIHLNGLGSAGFAPPSPLTMTNCTLAENTAGVEGGGVYRVSSSDSVATVSNCIVWGNTAPTNPQLSMSDGSTITVDYSCVQGGYSGNDNINTDPQFINPAFGDFRIGPNSPCIDAAGAAIPSDSNDVNSNGDTAELTPDLDWGPRTENEVDIGAFEWSCDAAPGTQDCNNNGVRDYCDILFATSTDCNGNGVPDECESTCEDVVVCIDPCDVEIIFIFDTSASMTGQHAEICEYVLSPLRAWLDATSNISSTITLLKLGASNATFNCSGETITTVVAAYGSGGSVNVPGDTGDCLDTLEEIGAHDEAMGPAIAVVAENHNWSATWRIIIPIGDEPHCNGWNQGTGSPEDALCEAEDSFSVSNAVAFALANDVMVLQVTGEKARACVREHADELADETIGQAFGINTLAFHRSSQADSTANEFVAYEALGQAMLVKLQELAIKMCTECKTVHPCAPDLNADGTVDVLDLLILLAAWGACPDPNDCPADLNGSGAVDVQDLLILLAAWGPCPEFAGDPWSGTTVPETVQDCLNMYTGTLLEKCLEMIAQMEELLGEE